MEKKEFIKYYTEIIFTAIIIVCINTVAQLFTIMLIWNWLVVPLFSAAEITYLQAFVLSIFGSFLSYKDLSLYKKEEIKEENLYGELVINGISYLSVCAIVILTAWIITFYI